MGYHIYRFTGDHEIMKRQQGISRSFNFICAVLSAFFVLGMVWVWRDIIVTGNQPLVISGIDNKSLEIEDGVATTTAEIKKEMSEVLPARVNLDVPFTSQAPEKNWAQPWQDACEEASLLMLDAFYKGYDLSPLFAKEEILKVVAWEEERGWGGSIEMGKVKEIWDKYFNRQKQRQSAMSKVVENPIVDDIKRFVADGNPVLVLANGKALPNPHFRNGGPMYHSLVIRGYDGNEFIVNDPGTQFGKNFRYRYDDLMNAMRDYMPADGSGLDQANAADAGDAKYGRKAMLVIEW